MYLSLYVLGVEYRVSVITAFKLWFKYDHLVKEPQFVLVLEIRNSLNCSPLVMSFSLNSILWGNK